MVNNIETFVDRWKFLSILNILIKYAIADGSQKQINFKIMIKNLTEHVHKLNANFNFFFKRSEMCFCKFDFNVRKNPI